MIKKYRERDHKSCFNSWPSWKQRRHTWVSPTVNPALCVGLGLSWWLSGQESACQPRDTSSIPESERPLGERNGKERNGLPFSSPGDLLPGIKLTSPALAGRFFTTEPPGKPFTCLFIWPSWVLVVPHGIFSCGVKLLVVACGI